MQAKIKNCSRLMKTGLNNVVLPTLSNDVNNIVGHFNSGLQADAGLTTLLTTCNFYSAESLSSNNMAIEENEEDSNSETETCGEVSEDMEEKSIDSVSSKGK